MIQIAMAQKIAEIEQTTLEEVVLRSTALYRIFGLDWSFDPANPIWKTYLDGLHRATDPVQYTYDYYLQRYPTIPTSAEEQTHWGCFAYDYNTETKKIRLHFGDYDQSGHGPLSHLRIAQRKEELRAMFQEIQHTHPASMEFFLQKVRQLERVEEYPGCFPYAELWTEAPISLFYEFYL